MYCIEATAKKKKSVCKTNYVVITILIALLDDKKIKLDKSKIIFLKICCGETYTKETEVHCFIFLVNNGVIKAFP